MPMVTIVQRLDEKWRPATFKDVVGQESAIRKITTVLSRGWGARAFWLSGDSGTGKTTLAHIIAKSGATDADIGDHFGRITEVVGREMSPAGLTAIMHDWMFAGGHALIVNEAHGLNKVMIEIFLNVLEQLRPNVVVIFTTTNEGEDLFNGQADAAPFASRCLCLNLKSDGLTIPFARRAKFIARKENLDGRPITAYRKLMKRHNNNLRAALSEIEAGAMLED